jgi:antitoxin CptB
VRLNRADEEVIYSVDEMTEERFTSHQSDPANRARLRWRSRRGLLENDIILTRFLDAHETELTDEEVDALTRLLDLSDNMLMDLVLGRKEPQDEADLPHVRALLQRLRQA